MGIRVGYNGRDRLNRAFGQGKYFVGGHSNSQEEWEISNPRSKVTTDGFSYTREGELIEGLTWTTEDLESHPKPRGKIPKSKGWLGKIYIGMTEPEALKIAKSILGKSRFENGDYSWTQKGWSIPSDLNGQDPFQTWKAHLRFASGKVASIEIDCTG